MRHDLMRKLSNRIATRWVVAITFTTDEALERYLEEHPDADRKNHEVVKTPLEELSGAVDALSRAGGKLAKKLTDFVRKFDSDSPPSGGEVVEAKKSLLRILFSSELDKDDLQQLQQLHDWIKSLKTGDEKDEKERVTPTLDVDVDELPKRYRKVVLDLKLEKSLPTLETAVKQYRKDLKEDKELLQAVVEAEFEERGLSEELERARKAAKKRLLAYREAMRTWEEGGKEGAQPEPPDRGLIRDDVGDDVPGPLVDAVADLEEMSNPGKEDLDFVLKALKGDPLSKKLSKATPKQVGELLALIDEGADKDKGR